MPNDSPHSDERLVQAFQAGDDTAATALVYRHGTRLGRFLQARGVPTDDVEDLVQEAFFKAFRALGTWRREASFRSWLYRIALNLGRDAYRRRRHWNVVDLDEVPLAGDGDPAGLADRHEAEDRVTRLLPDLPRLQREVFLLRAGEGMDYAEIARVLGTTPGAARVHYHHAVRRLKECVA